MNSQELYEYLEEQLEANPILEITEEIFFSDKEYAISEEHLQWQECHGPRTSKFSEEEDECWEDDSVNMILSTGITLKEYLLLQLQSANISKEQLPLAEYLIDNIDENGYLVSKLSDAAAFFNIPVKEVEKVLKSMQTLEPAGIFARDLKECLLIQIRQFNNVDKDVYTIVEKYLDKLASDKTSEVSKLLGMDEEKLNRLFSFIKTLEPKPGREFYSISDVKNVEPDIFIKKVNGRYEAFHNEQVTPEMRISSYYRRMLKQDIGTECEKFIQDKISEAKQLIKCLKLRKKAIKLVAQYILHKEAELFEKEKKHMLRLDLQSAAKEMGICEFVLKTIIEGKYIQCPWGNVEMVEFISL